jgi:hypothetical protein
MESIGIDVHKVNSEVCVVGENTEVLEERGSKQIGSGLQRRWASGRRREC